MRDGISRDPINTRRRVYLIDPVRAAQLLRSDLSRSRALGCLLELDRNTLVLSRREITGTP